MGKSMGKSMGEIHPLFFGASNGKKSSNVSSIPRRADLWSLGVVLYAPWLRKFADSECS